ncbi:hypothetical protein HDV00_009823 [Rhizophlyctis rosea]|nr:hypothetical protein HDV00_009823 [Rhizophlyctis rosea]
MSEAYRAWDTLGDLDETSTQSVLNTISKIDRNALLGDVVEHVPIYSSRRSAPPLHSSAPHVGIFSNNRRSLSIYNIQTRQCLGQFGARNCIDPMETFISSHYMAANIVAIICTDYSDPERDPIYASRYDSSISPPAYAPLYIPDLIPTILKRSPFYQSQSLPSPFLGDVSPEDVFIDSAGTKLGVVVSVKNYFPVRFGNHTNVGDVHDHTWFGLLLYDVNPKANTLKPSKVYDLDRLIDFLATTIMEPGLVYSGEKITAESEGIPYGAAALNSRHAQIYDTQLHGRLALLLFRISHPHTRWPHEVGQVFQTVVVGVDIWSGEVMWAVAVDGLGERNVHDIDQRGASVVVGGISLDGTCWWVAGWGEVMVADCSGKRVAVAGLETSGYDITAGRDRVKGGVDAKEEDPHWRQRLRTTDVDCEKCIKGECLLWMERRVVVKGDGDQEDVYEYVFKHATW